MTDDQYLNMNFDPLPASQRIRKHVQASPIDSPPGSSETFIKTSNTTTADNITNSVDTTTTTTISSPQTVTATNTIPITSVTKLETTYTFANTLSNMSNYKEDLIHKLLGKQGWAATTNSNNPKLWQNRKHFRNIHTESSTTNKSTVVILEPAQLNQSEIAILSKGLFVPMSKRYGAALDNKVCLRSSRLDNNCSLWMHWVVPKHPLIPNISHCHVTTFRTSRIDTTYNI